MAADPSGHFLAAVVPFDTAKATSGLLPGSSSHDDVYLCDYGPPERPTSGNGCRGLRHDSTKVVAATIPANTAGQRVAAGSVPGNGVFAVAGPDKFVTLWRVTSDQPDWTVSTEDNYPALNITMARDASRIMVGTAPTSPTAGGRVEARWGNGTLDWYIALTSADGGNARPTSLDYSRSGNVLAIGTDKDVLFADPAGTKPSGSLGALSQADTVSKVQLSGDGKYVVAGATNGIFLATLERSGGQIRPVANSVFNRNFGETAQDVCISVDGARFAAAAGTKIHFFRRLDTAAVAEPAGDAYDTGARVADIAYDEKGQILVAVSGNRVLAFGPSKSTPIWSFDATQSAFGSLDGPLRRVTISDDGQRIFVAGKTKTMAYSSVIGVTASLTSSGGASTIQPTQTSGLTLSVKNTGSVPDNYTFSVVPPVGWPSTSANAMNLDPDQVGTAQFNVTAPAGMAPGVYGVQVRVRSQATDDVAARRNQPTTYLAGPSFNFTIPRSVVLKVEAPDERINLRQGSEQTVAVTLRNEGNAEGIVNLSVTQELTRGSSWDIRYQAGDQVRVPASGSATVSLVIRAPSDAGSGDRNTITIRAREGTTVEATDILTAYVDPQFGAALATNKTAWEFYPGQTLTINVNVTNRGNTEDTYNLTQVVTPVAVQNDWRVTVESPQVTISRGETRKVAVTVKAVATDAREAVLTIRAISQASSNGADKQETSLVLNLATIPRPPTEKDDRLLPAPGVFLLLGAIGILALARRGGRR